eukprot:scaffold394225_cov36-Prasinocladus_malaysianus.AAC.1
MNGMQLRCTKPAAMHIMQFMTATLECNQLAHHRPHESAFFHFISTEHMRLGHSVLPSFV